MLGIFEKIVWGLMLVLMIVLGSAFYLLGMPSTQPYIVTASRDLNERDAKKNMSEAARGRLAKIQEGIANKNKDGQGSRRPVTPSRTYKGVNRAMYERISNVSDALAEAELAEGFLNDSGRWVIDKFESNNLFHRIGFQEKDEIESINLFSMSSLAEDTSAGISLYSSLKKEFEAGVPIVVSIRRNGRPMQIIFTPDDF